MNSQRNWELDSKQKGLTGNQRWQELGRRPIQVSRSPPYHFSVAVVRQPMNKKGPHLADDRVGNIARTLSSKTDTEGILTTFLGNQVEGVEGVATKLIAELLV